MSDEEAYFGKWKKFFDEINARGDPLEFYQDLKQAYLQGNRKHHNLDHVMKCLSELESVPELADNIKELKMAIWYKNYFFDPRRRDNEQRSAGRAAKIAKKMGMNPGFSDRVRRLVLATEQERDGDNKDERLIQDIDISVLGSDPQTNNAYFSALREEYNFVSDEDFSAALSRMVGTFLRRNGGIYRTEPFRKKYEQQAQLNLRPLARNIPPPEDKTKKEVVVTARGLDLMNLLEKPMKIRDIKQGGVSGSSIENAVQENKIIILKRPIINLRTSAKRKRFLKGSKYVVKRGHEEEFAKLVLEGIQSDGKLDIHSVPHVYRFFKGQPEIKRALAKVYRTDYLEETFNDLMILPFENPSPEELIKLLKEYKSRGINPSSQYDHLLASAAKKNFGSLKNAKLAAGFFEEPEVLIGVAGQTNQGSKRTKTEDRSLARSIKYFFSALENPKGVSRMSKDELTYKLKELKEEGKNPRAADYPELYRAAMSAGGWNKAKIEAGLEPITSTKTWEKEDVIKRLEEIRKIDGKSGYNITQSLRNAATKYFGSLGEAKKLAGFVDMNFQYWSEEAVLEYFAIYRALGINPNSIYDQSLTNAAKNYFGNWSRAKKIAGIERITTERKWTKENVKEAFLELKRKGINPTSKSCGPLMHAARATYGTFNKAKLAAGFKTYKTSGKYPEFEKVIKLLKRRPSKTREVREYLKKIKSPVGEGYIETVLHSDGVGHIGSMREQIYYIAGYNDKLARERLDREWRRKIRLKAVEYKEKVKAFKDILKKPCKLAYLRNEFDGETYRQLMASEKLVFVKKPEVRISDYGRRNVRVVNGLMYVYAPGKEEEFAKIILRDAEKSVGPVGSRVITGLIKKLRGYSEDLREAIRTAYSTGKYSR